MLAVRSLGNRKIEVVEKEKPVASGHQVVVKVRASALCGSDLHGIYRKPDAARYTPGHELAGEVAEAGDSGRFKAGDRVLAPAIIGCMQCRLCRQGYAVYCDNPSILGFTQDGGHAEYVAVPDWHCLPVPEDVSFEAAALITDPIGVPFHAYRRMGLDAADTVGVFGLGPMGMGAVVVARFFGANVVAVEPNEYRRNLARGLGVDRVIDPASEDVAARVKEITQGEGLSKAAECSGTDAALRSALDLTRKLGHVAIIGENQKATINPSDHFNRKELTLSGSTCFNTGEYEDIVAMIRRGLKPERIVTHRFPLGKAPEAYRLFDEGKTGKVLFV